MPPTIDRNWESAEIERRKAITYGISLVTIVQNVAVYRIKGYAIGHSHEAEVVANSDLRGQQAVLLFTIGHNVRKAKVKDTAEQV